MFNCTQSNRFLQHDAWNAKVNNPTGAIVTLVQSLLYCCSCPIVVAARAGQITTAAVLALPSRGCRIIARRTGRELILVMLYR